MAATTLYNKQQDVIDRLSETGVLYLADDASAGSVSAAVQERIDDARRDAAAEVDAALAPWLVVVPFSQDEDSLNPWLRARSIDLAAERLAERKGTVVAESITLAATRARELLEHVRTGRMRAPNVPYPVDSFDDAKRQIGRPRVAAMGGD